MYIYLVLFADNLRPLRKIQIVSAFALQSEENAVKLAKQYASENGISGVLGVEYRDSSGKYHSRFI